MPEWTPRGSRQNPTGRPADWPDTRSRRDPSSCLVGQAGAFRASVAASTLLASTLLLAGCGGGSGGGSENVARLSGPNINIAVTIPAGWHQVIDSGNPNTPEMVSPITCMGSREVTCATGLARLATFAAPSVEAAAQTVQRAVTTSPGVRVGGTTSQGPGKVGHRDGFRLRFTFSNPSAKLVSEVAAVPTGSAAPDAQGNHEFSVVLVWVADVPGAPKQDVIDEIIGSVLVAGGHP
ncbi:MAG: hypothetical protein ACRDRW_22330 [Pseudonocardiaceae bacterium]